MHGEVSSTVPVVLVYCGPKDEGREREFQVLAEAANYRVLAYLKQYKRASGPFGIGRGKLEELKDLVKKLGAKKVIFYQSLKPAQVYRLEKELGVEVSDRIQLVLEIFARRAGSREAKLQIELARLRYELPLIRERIRLAKLGELPGFHGGGRYDFDAFYRHAVMKMARIRRELSKLRERKKLHRERRARYGYPIVAITGYTCAGKTTLFNALTSETKLVDDKPFATLSTYIRRVNVYGIPVLVMDTIGFIQDLPPFLIDAFYATLEDLVYSTLILLVIDAAESLSEIERKVDTCLDVFAEIGAISKPIIGVLNKIDLVPTHVIDERIRFVRERFPELNEVVAISALRGWGLDLLKHVIAKYIPQFVTAIFSADVKGLQEPVLEQIYRLGHVRKVDECNGVLYLTVEVRYSELGKLLQIPGLRLVHYEFGRVNEASSKWEEDYCTKNGS